MCGIHFSLSRTDFEPPSQELVRLLRNRGPDGAKKHETQIAVGSCHLYLSVTASVLALRGDHVAVQPLVDDRTGSVLCWNGEAWSVGDDSITGNDGEAIFRLLLSSAGRVCKPDESRANDAYPLQDGIINVLRSISGPFAFAFFDNVQKKMYYGRDHLGRRSLLQRANPAGALVVSSISEGARVGEWSELSADGISVLEMQAAFSSITSHENGLSFAGRHAFSDCLNIVPWHPSTDDGNLSDLRLPSLNMTIPKQGDPSLLLGSPSVSRLEGLLSESLRSRIQNVPEPPVDDSTLSVPTHSKIACLFSGGLDCTVICRLADGLLPPTESIDLLNVAFENPRAVASAGGSKVQSPYEICPDRLTGRKSVTELQRICPGRTWRFIGINVPYEETLRHRQQIVSLISPHKTEMDLSIACALYFAARGQGMVYDSSLEQNVPGTTSARVLLSGLGADELFAGYTRHATAFSRHGFQGLLDELDLDINRLGKRNLGRDDRVTSHWGREVRYPYLDERLLHWALSCPVWMKCGFGQEEQHAREGFDHVQLEPSKKVLRLLAWKLGMRAVAWEKKRAIQFGARTAKMETGRTKGTEVLTSTVMHC